MARRRFRQGFEIISPTPSAALSSFQVYLPSSGNNISLDLSPDQLQGLFRPSAPELLQPANADKAAEMLLCALVIVQVAQPWCWLAPQPGSSPGLYFGIPLLMLILINMSHLLMLIFF